jgi:ureidoacrylate peracid hydrolase
MVMVLSLDPRCTALVNVDMQRCFVEGSPLASPDGPALVARVNELARGCREAGALVVHTRGWLRPDGSNLGRVPELVPPFITDLYTAGAPTALFPDELEVAPGDVVLDKPRYGAFHGTDLDLVLGSAGVDTVVISGIATNICCDTTAREASQRDYRVVFLSDGTATKEMNGVPAAELQRATLASLSMVFVRIATVDEVITAMRSRQHASV